MNVFITGAAGFIGGSIATGLVRAGHKVTGLVRSAEQANELSALGITPVIGTLDDSALLAEQARAADAVINAASSDHRGAVEALLDALRGSNKVFLHTSGSSIVGDASGGKSSDVIYYEDNLPEPTVDKAARVAIDNLILAAAKDGVNSAVICNTLIYGHSLGVNRDSVQLPRLLKQARKSGVVRHVGTGPEHLVQRAHRRRGGPVPAGADQKRSGHLLLRRKRRSVVHRHDHGDCPGAEAGQRHKTGR